MRNLINKLISSWKRAEEMAYDEMNQQVYDEVAENFYFALDARFTINTDEFGEIEDFASMFKQDKPKILDVGCGMGRHARPLTLAGMDYIGIDISEKCVEKAQSSFPHTFLHMSLNDMNFPDNTFDGFWSMMSLQHYPKKLVGKSLVRLHAVLKQGGIGYILIPDGKADSLWAGNSGSKIKTHVACYQASEFSQKLEKAGFIIIEQKSRPFDINGGSIAHRFLVKKP